MVVASRPCLLIQWCQDPNSNSLICKKFLFRLRTGAPEDSISLTQVCHSFHPGGDRRVICIPCSKCRFTHTVLEIKFLIVNSNRGAGQQHSWGYLIFERARFERILAPAVVPNFALKTSPSAAQAWRG